MIRLKNEEQIHEAAMCAYENFCRVMAHYGLNPPNRLLIMHPDRTFFQFSTLEESKWFYDRCEMLRQENKLIYTSGALVANHGADAIMGWRENVSRHSLQLVAHQNLVLEADIDLFNPLYGDVYTAIGHWMECWFGGTTNPFKVKAALDKRYQPSRIEEVQG